MDAARGCALAGGCHGVSPPGEQPKTALWPARWAEDASHGQPTTDVNNGDWDIGGSPLGLCERAPRAGGGTGLACRSGRARRQQA